MLNLNKYLSLVIMMFCVLITGCNSGADAQSIDTSSYNESILNYDPAAPLQFRKISSSSSMKEYDEQWVTLTIFNNTDEEVVASNSFAGASNSAEIFSISNNLLLPEHIGPLDVWQWNGWIAAENNFNVRGLKIAPKQSGVMSVIVNREIYLNQKLELRIKFKGSQSGTVYPLKQEFI